MGPLRAPRGRFDPAFAGPSRPGPRRPERGAEDQARELGSWDLSLSVAWLVASWAPSRAIGLVPFTAALALVMVITGLLDVVAGRVALLNESTTSSAFSAWAWFGCWPDRPRVSGPSCRDRPSYARQESDLA